MKLVYTHDNPVLVGLARNLLENAGMEVTVKNEFTSTGMAAAYNKPELWLLDDADYDTAVEVLENFSEEV